MQLLLQFAQIVHILPLRKDFCLAGQEDEAPDPQQDIYIRSNHGSEEVAAATTPIVEWADEEQLHDLEDGPGNIFERDPDKVWQAFHSCL